MIISIDLETTGLDPEICQILEIGMVDEGGREFHCYVDNGIIIGEAYALQMNQKILKKIAEGRGISRWNVVEAIKAWFPEDFTVAGKNFGSFDLQFLKKLPGWDIKIKHRILDVGNLYWNGDGEIPDLETCMVRARIPGPITHTALEDAKIVMQLVKKFQNADIITKLI